MTDERARNEHTILEIPNEPVQAIIMDTFPFEPEDRSLCFFDFDHFYLSIKKDSEKTIDVILNLALQLDMEQIKHLLPNGLSSFIFSLKKNIVSIKTLQQLVSLDAVPEFYNKNDEKIWKKYLHISLNSLYHAETTNAYVHVFEKIFNSKEHVDSTSFNVLANFLHAMIALRHKIFIKSKTDCSV